MFLFVGFMEAFFYIPIIVQKYIIIIVVFHGNVYMKIITGMQIG